MPRRLIICCDGTWDKLGRKDHGVYAPTNVAKMARSIAPLDSGIEQVVFYDSGVGTGAALDRWTGGLMGVGLSDKIKDAYQFLIHNYAERDEIYLFGFSRGAYTVRSLAGLIRKCGIVHREHADSIAEAYDIYRIRSDTADSVRAKDFRNHHAWPHTIIKFVGCWDTVGSLGLPSTLFRFLFGSRYRFHDLKLSSRVPFAYHALAIDERRGPFRAALWEQQADAAHQTMEQVWFTGVHSDIGGGYRDTGLSDITFVWMMKKAEATGLAFNHHYTSGHLDPRPLAERHESRTFPFTLLFPHIRPIGQAPGGRESVDKSALQRFRELDEYNPKNLAAYLDRSDATGTSADA